MQPECQLSFVPLTLLPSKQRLREEVVLREGLEAKASWTLGRGRGRGRGLVLRVCLRWLPLLVVPAKVRGGEGGLLGGGSLAGKVEEVGPLLALWAKAKEGEALVLVGALRRLGWIPSLRLSVSAEVRWLKALALTSVGGCRTLLAPKVWETEGLRLTLLGLGALGPAKAKAEWLLVPSKRRGASELGESGLREAQVRLSSSTCGNSNSSSLLRRCPSSLNARLA